MKFTLKWVSSENGPHINRIWSGNIHVHWVLHLLPRCDSLRSQIFSQNKIEWTPRCTLNWFFFGFDTFFFAKRLPTEFYAISTLAANFYKQIALTHTHIRMPILLSFQFSRRISLHRTISLRQKQQASLGSVFFFFFLIFFSINFSSLEFRRSIV